MCRSVVEVVPEIPDSAFIMVETLTFAEYGLVGITDIEIDGAAVSFVVPFANVVVAGGVADGPNEVLVDELFRVLSEILFADFVLLS